MKQLSVLATALLVSACTSMNASTTEPRTIVVDGHATIKVQPDTFSLVGNLVSQNPDQAAGFAEVSDKLAAVRRTLPQLEGLARISIKADEVSIAAIREPDCAMGGNRDQSCPVIGRIAVIGLQIEGSPASRAGQAISLLSQLGAESVELSGFSLSDPKPSKENAITAAVADARMKAEAIARSAGATITGLAKVQYGRGFGAERGYADAFSLGGMWNDAPQVTTTVEPIVNLDLDPSPIEVTEQVVAAFSVQ